MSQPIWVRKDVVLATHNSQIAEHGGGEGLRDEGLLETALGRPENLQAYGDPPPTLPQLAAAYGYGIATNHPFVDGNKRTAYVTMLLFLRSNGLSLDASPEDKYRTLLALAEGSLSELQLAAWLKDNVSRLP